MKGKDQMAHIGLHVYNLLISFAWSSDPWKSSIVCTLLHVMMWFVKESCCVDLDAWVLGDLFHASNISQTCNDPLHCI